MIRESDILTDADVAKLAHLSLCTFQRRMQKGFKPGEIDFAQLFRSELDALLDVAQSETGRREIPMTRHERAAPRSNACAEGPGRDIMSALRVKAHETRKTICPAHECRFNPGYFHLMGGALHFRRVEKWKTTSRFSHCARCMTCGHG